MSPSLPPSAQAARLMKTQLTSLPPPTLLPHVLSSLAHPVKGVPHLGTLPLPHLLSCFCLCHSGIEKQPIRDCGWMFKIAHSLLILEATESLFLLDCHTFLGRWQRSGVESCTSWRERGRNFKKPSGCRQVLLFLRVITQIRWNLSDICWCWFYCPVDNKKKRQNFRTQLPLVIISIKTDSLLYPLSS